MRKVSLVLVLAAAACGGDSTTPTASGVFPAEGFTGRTLRVEISGDATTWKEGATVDFGAGVTVNSVDVASPTDLFADITIDSKAAPGKNDVTVTMGGKKFTLAKAFELVPPVAITYQGDVASFGVPSFTINNLDFETPFDIRTDPSTGAFTNLAITSPAGTEFIVGNATQYQITGQVFIDKDGMSGPVSIASGPAASAVTSVGDALTVMARTPEAFSGSATGTFTDVGSSAVYSVNATAHSVFHYALTTSAPDGSPASAVLGSGGSWRNDFLGANHVLLDSGTAYLVGVNLGGMGYQYSLTGLVETLTSATEPANDTTNGTSVGALVASAIPFEMTNGTLSGATDEDWIKVTISAGQANKQLHIVTDLGADPNTDTAVNLTDCTTGNTSKTGGVQDGTECGFLSCNSQGEDVTSDPLPAGTYCLKISAGQFFDPAAADYVAVFWLE